MGTVVEASGSAMGRAGTADEPARVALAAASASALQNGKERKLQYKAIKSNVEKRARPKIEGIWWQCTGKMQIIE